MHTMGHCRIPAMFKAILPGVLFVLLLAGCTKEEVVQPAVDTLENSGVKNGGRNDGGPGGVTSSNGGGGCGISDDGDDLGDNEGGRKPRKPRTKP